MTARGDASPTTATTALHTLAAAGLPVALAVTLVATAALRAGYDHAGRAVFVLGAGVCFLLALAAHSEAATRAGRRVPVVALLALGALSAASATWTVGAPSSAVEWGLVVAGFGGVCLAASTLAGTPEGTRRILGAIAVLAAAEGLLGLGAAALRELPLAERIGGSWRPGGTLEYPPALAFLQVAALPVCMSAACRLEGARALPGAAGLAIASGVLALSGTRTQLVLAALAFALVLARPQRFGVVDRRRVAAAGLLCVAVGVAYHLVSGGFVAPRDASGATQRMVLSAVVLAAALPTWLLLRAGAGAVALRRPVVARTGALALAAVAIAAGVLATAPLHGRGVERSGGFTHGRVQQWADAVSTALDRPLQGAGAEAYLTASLPHQRASPQRYAHSLPLEASAELGAGGLLLVLVLYVSTTAAAWRARNLDFAWLAAPGALAFLAANLVDWPWHLPLTAAVFACLLGVVLATPSSDPGPTADPPVKASLTIHIKH